MISPTIQSGWSTWPRTGGYHMKSIDEGLEARNPSYDRIKYCETIFRTCAKTYGREQTTELLDWFDEWMMMEQLVE